MWFKNKTYKTAVGHKGRHKCTATEVCNVDLDPKF